MLLWKEFVPGAPAWRGSSERGSWEKVEMVASTRSLHSLNSQKIPLDQLLIKAITKLHEKSQARGDSRCPCVQECVCVAETENGRKWGAYR